MTTREEMRSLAEGIVRSYKDRTSGVAELREIVKGDLKEFQDSRAAMAKDMRADLGRSGAARKAAVSTQLADVSTQLKELDAAHAAMAKDLRAELARSGAARKAAVSTQLKELDAAHAAMSREMRAELAGGHQAMAEGERERQGEAREFMGELGKAVAEVGKAVAEGKAATQSLLRDFGEVQAGARYEWQKMTATIRSKRGGVAVAVKRLIEETVEGAAEITPDTAVLREQVFEYLASHPDGTRLVELAEEFGVARIQMAKVVRSLIDGNKAEKRNLFYFAV